MSKRFLLYLFGVFAALAVGVAVSLDGVLANGIGYSLGHRQLATDTPGEADETATVLGVS